MIYGNVRGNMFMLSIGPRASAENDVFVQEIILF